MCEKWAVCSKVDMYQWPWVERQCRCPAGVPPCSQMLSPADGHTITDKTRQFKVKINKIKKIFHKGLFESGSCVVYKYACFSEHFFSFPQSKVSYRPVFSRQFIPVCAIILRRVLHDDSTRFDSNAIFTTRRHKLFSSLYDRRERYIDVSRDRFVVRTLFKEGARGPNIKCIDSRVSVIRPSPIRTIYASYFTTYVYIYIYIILFCYVETKEYHG